MPKYQSVDEQAFDVERFLVKNRGKATGSGSAEAGATSAAKAAESTWRIPTSTAVLCLFLGVPALVIVYTLSAVLFTNLGAASVLQGSPAAPPPDSPATHWPRPDW